jgi:hypothetical protein
MRGDDIVYPVLPHLLAISNFTSLKSFCQATLVV